jgi:hypothetical protein
VTRTALLLRQQTEQRTALTFIHTHTHTHTHTNTNTNTKGVVILGTADARPATRPTQQHLVGIRTVTPFGLL